MLGLEIQKSTALEVTVVRDLTLDDLQALAREDKGAKAKPLVKIRARHHAIARAQASGLGYGEVAVVAGVPVQRVYQLQDDPTYKELVEFYRADIDAKMLGMHESLAALGEDVVEEIRDRLETQPDKFSLADLSDLLKTAADRTGHGPSSKQTVDIKIGLADKLAAARKRLESAMTIDATATVVEPAE